MEDMNKVNNENLKGKQEEFFAIQNEVEKLKMERAEQQMSLQGAIPMNPYYHEQNPREYLHRFLLEASQVGCNVDRYIIAEVDRMLNELER